MRDIIRQSLSKNRQSEKETSQSHVSDEKQHFHKFGKDKDQSQNRSRNQVDMDG